MPTSVFTYGSLMFADVWQRVVAGQYRSAPAILPGYFRHALHDVSYPGIIPAAHASVTGVVYFDVSDADLLALDHFEGTDYRRIEASAIGTDGAPVQVQTYLFLHASRLTGLPWIPESFDLPQFLASYCRDKLGS